MRITPNYMARAPDIPSLVYVIEHVEYCKRYDVDWRCAAIDLKQLGIQLDSEYPNRREQSERQVVKERIRRRESRTSEHSLHHPIEYESSFDAYLAKDFSALHAMECQRTDLTQTLADPFLPTDVSSACCASEQRPQLGFVEIWAMAACYGLLTFSPCFVQPVQDQQQFMNANVGQ